MRLTSRFARKQTAQPSLEEMPVSSRPSLHEFFHRFSRRTAHWAGSPWTFVVAVALIFLWSLSRPFFKSFDTWQLVINTATTIITFLMVFVLQNSQNRESKAIQLKLDELLRGVEGARTGLVNLEDLTDRELDVLEQEFISLRKRLAGASQGKELPPTGH